MFSTENNTPWAFSTPHPSLADVSLHYQLAWGADMAAGRGIENLTGGGAKDTPSEGIESFFTQQRYPGLSRWFKSFRDYIDSVPSTETRVTDTAALLDEVKAYEDAESAPPLLPTAAPQLERLDELNGLKIGATVSIAPDDTGRASPTIGRLVALSTEEAVIKPEGSAPIEVNIHFPRLGFVIRPVDRSRLS